MTPLRERVRETQEALTQQYDQLQGRVEELHHKQESIEQTLSRRISNAELGIQELKAASPPPHHHRHQPHSGDMEDLARRAQSVPPQQRFNAADLSQDDLLERSIMLYGCAVILYKKLTLHLLTVLPNSVWALEKRLGS